MVLGEKRGELGLPGVGRRRLERHFSEAARSRAAQQTPQGMQGERASGDEEAKGNIVLSFQFQKRDSSHNVERDVLGRTMGLLVAKQPEALLFLKDASK